MYTNVETRIVAVMRTTTCTDRFVAVFVVGTALVENALEPEVEVVVESGCECEAEVVIGATL